MNRGDSASPYSVRRSRRPQTRLETSCTRTGRTSRTPAVKPGSRPAGEGKSHTARMYVPEESHSGIVPMNQSNKDREPSAENEEERPLIKENAGQPNTHLTQSGERVSQGLAGVRKVARDNKEMKFTALLHHLTVDLLRESFYSLKRKAAPGVDGVTWQEYEIGVEDRLIDLHGRVHRGAKSGCVSGSGACALVISCSSHSGMAWWSSPSHFTGTSTGAPLSLTKNTTNFAGLVLLAFRPTT